MSPRLRNEVAGATYHVVARGADRRRIFVDDEDYQTYGRLLASVALRQGWRLLSFALMPNHIHLLIETPETNLGNGIQWLHSRYALAFNKRHFRVGHLFESPYKSSVVSDDLSLVRTTGYVVMNPVAAVLCRRAVDWPWGSHAIVGSGHPAPRWLNHARLEHRLEQIGGPRFYARYIVARERDLNSKPSESALSLLGGLAA